MAGSDYRSIYIENSREVSLDSIYNFPVQEVKCGFTMLEEGLILSDSGLRPSQVLWTRIYNWDIFTKYISQKEGHGTLLVAISGSRVVLAASVFGLYDDNLKGRLYKFKEYVFKTLRKALDV